MPRIHRVEDIGGVSLVLACAGGLVSLATLKMKRPKTLSPYIGRWVRASFALSLAVAFVFFGLAKVGAVTGPPGDMPILIQRMNQK